MSDPADPADITIAEIPKNSRETLKVTVGSYRGHQLVHVRVWCPNKTGTELIPTKAGFAVRRAILPDLITALQKVMAAPEARTTASEPEAVQ